MKLPPSLSGGISDTKFKEERTLFELGRAIKKLSPDVNSTLHANHLYDNFCLAGMWARAKKKEGSASPTSVAKQFKQIASASATLSKRLTDADKNVFSAWADASEDADEFMFRDRALQDWLQLRKLLDETQKRATQAGRAAEKALKLWRQVGKKGRPADQTTDFITRQAADLYEATTRELAMRSVNRDTGKPEGAFHNFLIDVFQALRIPASPDEANRRLQTTLKR